MKSYQKLNLNKLIKVSMLSVIALLLMQIEISLSFLFPGFLKFDLSDLPALFGGFALGPLAGLLIILLKNILHGILMTKTAFIGEIANFSVGVFWVFISSYIYNKNKSKKSAIIGMVVGTVIMSIVAGVLNYYIFIPAFAKLYGQPIEAFVKMASKVNGKVTNFKLLIYWSIIPFNLIKGSIVSIVSLGVYRVLLPIVEQERVKQERQIKC